MEVFRRLPRPARGRFTAADLAAAVPGEPPAGRPFVLLNMIATADGRATIAGRTAPLANRADYELFHALRERVDAVMVGAETVRVEGYGPMAQLAVVVSRSVDAAGRPRPARRRGQPRGDRHAVARPRAAAVRRERELPARGRPRGGAAAPARGARRGLDRLRGRSRAQRDARARRPGRRAAPRDRAEARRRARPAHDPRRRRARPAAPTSRCCRCTSPAATCSRATAG